MALAFLFPGQGSQSVGMVSALAQRFPIVEETFREASAALDLDLWQMVSSGPEEALNRTEITQPAILSASVAMWRLWQEEGGEAPEVMAGHSLGEYSALVAASSLSFADAVRLVAKRGELMQQAVAPGAGAMAAILGLDDATVIRLCETESTEEGVVAAVNFNAPGQVVIAGSSSAVAAAVVAAKAEGAKRAVTLPVSVPSHCSLMLPAAEGLSQVLEKIAIHPPQIAVVNNCDVAIEREPEQIKRALVRQLTHPVRWVESVTTMVEGGATHFVECGPGKVLAGLNKRIVKAIPLFSILDETSLHLAVAESRQ
ncbi:MAG: ACP S-malonyltransferase [Gammaproteobacteria bacterium]|nr:ACP S-malonyltransferase [Gammaproteobacteria bacterium]